MKSVSLLLCFLTIIGWCASSPAQAGHADTFAHSTQMIVVTTPDWSAIEGLLQRYERATVHEKWHPVGEPFSIVVGKSGLGWGLGVLTTDDVRGNATSDPVKREGDGKSPAGVFALGTAFGYAPQPLRGLKMSYLNLTSSTECVDDIHSKYYNRIVDRSAVTRDWNSAEHMREAGESYRWGIVLDHNRIVTENNNPPEPGGGSCVFVHIWHRHDQGTVGCTAMSQSDLETLLLWLDPERKPLLVQLPRTAYERLMSRWILPELIHTPSR